MPDLRPFDAELSIPKTELLVTVDGSLVESQGLDVENWVLGFGGKRYEISSVAASGSVVTLAVSEGLEGDPADHVDFSPPPFDVEGEMGRVLRAFANFPVHQDVG